MSAETQQSPLPVVEFVKIPKDGEPYLEGYKCKACSAVFLGERDVCAKCGARGKIAATKLSNDGSLYVYSIVHRSFPGIEVPYVSAIVDLEGGGTRTFNWDETEVGTGWLYFGWIVRVVYKDALGRKDREGNEYLSYFFEPR